MYKKLFEEDFKQIFNIFSCVYTSFKLISQRAPTHTFISPEICAKNEREIPSFACLLACLLPPLCNTRRRRKIGLIIHIHTFVHILVHMYISTWIIYFLFLLRIQSSLKLATRKEEEFLVELKNGNWLHFQALNKA